MALDFSNMKWSDLINEYNHPSSPLAQVGSALNTSETGPKDKYLSLYGNIAQPVFYDQSAEGTGPQQIGDFELADPTNKGWNYSLYNDGNNGIKTNYYQQEHNFYTDPDFLAAVAATIITAGAASPALAGAEGAAGAAEGAAAAGAAEGAAGAGVGAFDLGGLAGGVEGAGGATGLGSTFGLGDAALGGSLAPGALSDAGLSGGDTSLSGFSGASDQLPNESAKLAAQNAASSNSSSLGAGLPGGGGGSSSSSGLSSLISKAAQDPRLIANGVGVLANVLGGKSQGNTNAAVGNAASANGSWTPTQQQWANNYFNTLPSRTINPYQGDLARAPIVGGEHSWFTQPGQPAPAQMATGGMVGALSNISHGQSDDVPIMGSRDEYMIPADAVSALGSGSSNAGAEVLDNMIKAIRMHHRSANINDIPPTAKSPLEYMRDGMKGQ